MSIFSSDFQSIRVAVEDRVLIVTLNRPAALNSLHAPACVELDTVWNAFEADPDLWIAIVTGEGRAFCAGHDLVEHPDAPMPPSGWAGLSERTPIAKPMIAAINGHAFGGGFEIALACDLLVVDEKAKLALSEPKVGAVALGGGAQRLIRRAPAAIAMELLLTGRAMDAEEGRQWGIVNEVAPHGEALNAARALAQRILQCSPLAVRETKRLAMQVLDGDLPSMVAEGCKDVSSRIFGWADTQEGIAAFKEKRQPRWTGR